MTLVLTPQQTAEDQAANLFELLDAAHFLASYMLITLWSDHYAPGVAERVLRIWARSHESVVDDRLETYGSKSYRILYVTPSTFKSPRITLHCEEIQLSTLTNEVLS